MPENDPAFDQEPDPCMIRCPSCSSRRMTFESHGGDIFSENPTEPYDKIICHDCNCEWDREEFIRDHPECFLSYEESQEATAERDAQPADRVGIAPVPSDIIPSSDYIPSSDHERWASNYVKWLGAAPSVYDFGNKILHEDAGAEIVLEGDDSKCIVGVQAIDRTALQIAVKALEKIFCDPEGEASKLEGSEIGRWGEDVAKEAIDAIQRQTKIQTAHGTEVEFNELPEHLQEISTPPTDELPMCREADIDQAAYTWVQDMKAAGVTIFDAQEKIACDVMEQALLGMYRQGLRDGTKPNDD